MPAEVELRRSSGGVFEVTAAGRLIYSKRATGVFPDPEAIIAALEKMTPQ